MDGKPFQLVPFPQESISRPEILYTLTAETIPSLKQLHDIKKDIISHKKAHEQRLNHSLNQLSTIEPRMKDLEQAKDKQPKKGMLIFIINF